MEIDLSVGYGDITKLSEIFRKIIGTEELKAISSGVDRICRRMHPNLDKLLASLKEISNDDVDFMTYLLSRTRNIRDLFHLFINSKRDIDIEGSLWPYLNYLSSVPNLKSIVRDPDVENPQLRVSSVLWYILHSYENIDGLEILVLDILSPSFITSKDLTVKQYYTNKLRGVRDENS